ncbi:hypothetical protein D9M71_785820 [compost metagenome]
MVCHLLILFLGIGRHLTHNNFLPIWLVFVIFPNVIFSLVKKIYSIELKNDTINLVFDKWFFKKHEESYRYDDLLFTYKEEIEGKSWGNRLRIYKKGNEKSVISTAGFVDGFGDDEIKKIIIELEKRGIEVKTK